MPLERSFSPSMAKVTLSLVSGETHSGYLRRFSPAEPDIVLSPTHDGRANGRFAAEQVAWVGFHREPQDPPLLPHRGALKLRASSGETFLVDLAEDGESRAIGSYVHPADPSSPYREMFFYEHGISLREVNEPLGELLVKEGRVAPAALDAGISLQQHETRTPIGQILLETRRIHRAALDQAVTMQQRRGTRIGEILIEANLASANDIEFALGEQRKRGGRRIGQILVEMNVISEVDLAAALSRKFHLPCVDLDGCAINLESVAELPRDFIEKHRLLPVDSDERSLTIAIADPLAVDSLDLVHIHSRKQICEVVVTASQLDKYIPIYLDRLESHHRASDLDEILKGLAAGDGQAVRETEVPETSLVSESDNAIIKLANQIIVDAYRRGASDIHIEPNGREATTRVRFRIDGDCVSYQDIPSAYRLPLIARFKIMATLDIAERRKPQDGKIRFQVGERRIELRVATIPTVNNNEDIVLRILAGSKPLPLEQMGLSAHNLDALESVIRKPYGLVLCVGPTGSGKTTTLHSALGAINTVDTKIWTAEDPVEITQAGLRQVQVHPKIGFTFAAAMRAFLRADPDVIMVGEMRDRETAETAIEASLTGHLVLSTLHTNSAPETVTRLIDMGLDPFSFADALLGVLAQRLARTLCKQCRDKTPASAEEVEELSKAYGPEAFQEFIATHCTAQLELWRAVGCSACGASGYKGRIGIHELLVSDDELKRAVQHKAPVDDLRRIAAELGMKTLLQDGIEKVLGGETDLKQVLAVCSR